MRLNPVNNNRSLTQSRSSRLVGVFLLSAMGTLTNCKKKLEQKSAEPPSASSVVLLQDSGLSASDSGLSETSVVSAKSPVQEKLARRLLHKQNHVQFEERVLREVPVNKLVSSGAWEILARKLDAAPEAEWSLAQTLARLKAGVAICNKAEGLKSLALLGKLRSLREHGWVSDVTARLEIDADYCAEKFRDALEFNGYYRLAARHSAVGQSRYARALFETLDFEGARNALDRAMRDAPRMQLPIAPLMFRHIEVCKKLGDKDCAESDVLRLFREFPVAYDDAVKALRVTPIVRASGADLLKRAEAYASLGKLPDALASIAAAKKLSLTDSPDEPSAKKQRTFERAEAWAHYRAKAYEKASSLLFETANKGTDRDALRDLFHAARAKSRSGDDDQAIIAYGKIAAKYKGTNEGAEAMFLIPSLHLLHGRIAQALEGFIAYLASAHAHHAGQEANVREALRLHAICLLELGRLGEAKAAFATLARKERDSFYKTRYELLFAIAAERQGDFITAKSVYHRLSRVHRYAYVDYAARARLMRLGEKVDAWPSEPAERMTLPATLAFEKRSKLLLESGFFSDAYHTWIQEKQGLRLSDVHRCIAFDLFERSNEAMLLGGRLRISGAPDYAEGWAWRCAFPTPYEDIVTRLEDAHKLPKGLIFAVIRQESGFRPEAISHAGAVGLTQLMSYTAKETIERYGLSVSVEDPIRFSNVYNQLSIAALHLRDLFDELGGEVNGRSVPLVIAAYNAGMGSVKKWLASAGESDSELFIERMFFTEARHYTMHVVGNWLRYSLMFGRKPYEFPAKFGAEK